MTLPKRFTTCQMDIVHYDQNFKDGHFGLSKWQRGEQPIWKKDGYREELITSVMNGTDIPKIYIADISGKKVIIDGGHRSRAFRGYINNEYSISIGDKKVYYSSLTRILKNNRVMTIDEKEQFDKFLLTIVTYDNISEKDARIIFNRLQNTAPMMMPDIVNSWESPLVDYLRSLEDHEINRVKLIDHFRNTKGLPKPDNNQFLYHCLSWFTIVHPVENECSQCDNAMKFIEKGKDRNSPCFQYLKRFHDDFNDEITDDMKSRFEKAVEFLIRINLKSSNSDQVSLLHSHLWIDDFSLEEFIKFDTSVNNYNKEKSRADKLFKGGKHADAEELSSAMDKLNTEYEGKLYEWIHSRTKGGSSYSGMKKRMDIIMKFCVDNNKGDEEAEPIIFTPNEGVPLPIVKMLS